MEQGAGTVDEDCRDLMVEMWLEGHFADGMSALERVAAVDETGWTGSVPEGIAEGLCPSSGSLFPSGSCLACLGEETVSLKNGPLSC